MLTKIKLFYQIRKFYKIYGSEIGANFITELSDMTNDNLYDVLFDINKVLYVSRYIFNEEAYEEDAWLNKLNTQIQNFRDGIKPKHQHNYTWIITSILVLLALIGGYTIGRQHTIRQAELLEVTEADYNIGFGDEVHNYTFD